MLPKQPKDIVFGVIVALTVIVAVAVLGACTAPTTPLCFQTISDMGGAKRAINVGHPACKASHDAWFETGVKS